MAKIPFTLDAWLKDKSQKVETRDGRIVHNIWPVKEQLIFNGKRAEVCALIDGEEDALLFFEGGKYLPVDSENPFDLFIVTPDINGAKPQTMLNFSLTLTKERMAKLLETAKKLLEEDRAQYEEEFEKL